MKHLRPIIFTLATCSSAFVFSSSARAQPLPPPQFDEPAAAERTNPPATYDQRPAQGYAHTEQGPAPGYPAGWSQRTSPTSPWYQTAEGGSPRTRLRSPTALGFGIGLLTTAATHVLVGASLHTQDCEGQFLCFQEVGTALLIGGSIVSAGGLALIIVGGTSVDVGPAEAYAHAKAAAPVTLEVAASPTGITLNGKF